MDFAFRVAVIYALLGYAILGLGLIGGCRPPAVAAAACLAALAFLHAAFRALKTRRPWRAWRPYLLLAVLTLLAYSHALLIPPFARDDMIYHLQVPKLLAMTGRLAFDPFNANSNFPLLFEMPFAALAVLRAPPSPLLPFAVSPFAVNVAFAVLWVLVFHGAVARHTRLSPGQNMAASMALATTPVVFDLLHTGYAELFFALLILLAALFHLRHLEAESRGAWLRACACLGLACAVKYPGVIFAALFFAHESFRGRDRKLLYGGALLCAAIAAPWYAKSWILTGNPVFPLANSLFASPYMSAMRFQGFHRMLADYHMGRAPIDWILLPFRLALGLDEARPGVGLGFDGRLSLLFAVGAAGLGWKGADRRFATLVCAAYFAVWAVESQQARFLLAVLPLAAVFGLGRAGALPGRAWWLCLGAAIVIAQNLWHVTVKLRADGILPLLAGETDANAFLSAQMPVSYVLSGEINSRLHAERDKLMTVGTFGRNYYFDVPTLSNTFYEQEVFRNAFTRGRTAPDSLTAFLDRTGVTHVLFNWDYLRKMHAGDAEFDLEGLQAYFADACETLYAGNGTILYRRKKADR
ncbi:MAG TPA: glycosyltransferase family 39 protein [Fibrobacteria bacterium]|nr:glycosyltransferase family 39 protein [Fibrobacteria bacterium]